ncbi:hypothetical protein [Arthrobacter alpinus]|uniref:hypothetical protein n=1 Tax=Arthrobacter alpinus TaxID=656366 RepID=UPI00164544FA|nr:hypothetical protein [Arthrobacter alpinus]
MTKLIVVLAVLAALAWGVTALASWITKKKAPLAITAGPGPRQVSAAERKKAMVRAQLPTAVAIIFSIIMFVALFRVSIALAGQVGQAGMAVVLTAVLSTSGGLLMFSALPSREKVPGTPQRLVAGTAFIVPVAAFLAFLACLVAAALSTQVKFGWAESVPLIVGTIVLAGAAYLALRRISTTVSLPDPRMAALDRQWREVSACLLLRFTGGALLACFGATAIVAGLSIIITVAGAALALAGAAQLFLAAQGALKIRTTVGEGTPSPITA